MSEWTYEDIAGIIDHALLQPTMTDDELRNGCEWARSAGVATVCIKPYAVKTAATILNNSKVKVGTVIGFPHGGVSTAIKVEESKEVIQNGAGEIDMVVNIGKVLSRDWTYVALEIAAVMSVAKEHHAILKVIFETSLLKDEHKIRLCEICGTLGVHFVKTSTGYGDGGATDHDIRLMRRHSPAKVQIKASGGIRTFARLLELRDLGVTRIGTTSSAAILQEVRTRLG